VYTRDLPSLRYKATQVLAPLGVTLSHRPFCRPSGMVFLLPTLIVLTAASVRAFDTYSHHTSRSWDNTGITDYPLLVQTPLDRGYRSMSLYVNVICCGRDGS